MEWSLIFKFCVFPLLAVLTGYIVKWINAKTNEIKEDSDNAMADKYLTMVNETVTNCVITTNQTYVDTLKAQGKFDEEAQKFAFQKTLETIKTMLSAETIKYLTNIYNDVDLYLQTKIETEGNYQK